MYTLHSKYNFASACEYINMRVFQEENHYITIDNKCEILDDETCEFIETLSELDVSFILYDFGLDKAIKSYQNDVDNKIATSKELLYHIIREGLCEHDGYVNDEDLDESIKEVVDYLLEKQLPLTDDEKAAELAEREDY